MSNKKYIYALSNQKGGVGKTTSCINLAASLAATKKSVLLVDMDPQGNATTGSGIDKSQIEQSIYEVLIGSCSANEVILRSESGQYDVLPANGNLTAAEVQLLDLDNRELRLSRVLDGLSYDYIFIDCPPSLNMLTLNALVACDGVIVPMQCEYYALEGLSSLVSTIEQVRDQLNPRLEITGVLRTMYDARNNLTNDVSNQLREFFGDKVFRSCVPRNVRLAEAPSFGQPVLAYDKDSKGAVAYLALAGELICRNDITAA